MYSYVSSITTTTTLIALFSLMWFVIGIVIGRLVPGGIRTKSPSGNRGSASRGGRSSSSGLRNTTTRGANRNGNRGGGRTSSQGSRDGKSGLKGAVELYVGNLPYSTSKKDLTTIFSEYGTVVSVRMIENRSNGKPKGFGFVELENQSQAEKAIKGLSGTKIEERAIVVSEAKSRERND
jgi:RNA recognition motif-containing protein